MKIVAHRGASLLAPENTMTAFGRAIEAGADVIEFDVQASADGRLVVIHDATLDRTTDGTGAVFETEWRAIEHLDAGSWFSPDFAYERVPTAAEVLSLADIEFELELKGYGRDFLERVLDAVRAADAFDRVEFTSGNALLLAALKRAVPTALIGLFSMRQPSWMPESVFEHHVVGTAATSGADVAHVHAASLTSQISERLRDMGFQVHANDAVSEGDVQRAILADADRLSVNDVDLARRLLSHQD